MFADTAHVDPAAGVSAETPAVADWVALLSDEVLEKELATHAAQLAAAECRFCLMVAEVDARGFWATQGAPPSDLGEIDVDPSAWPRRQSPERSQM